MSDLLFPVAVFDTDYSLVQQGDEAQPPLQFEDFQDGLMGFLNRQALIAPTMDRTLILTGEVLTAFGIPATDPAADDPKNAPTEHPVLEDIRRGWQVSALAPYMRCRHKMDNGRTLTLTLVIFDWLRRESTPMLMLNGPVMTAMRMWNWYETTGVFWYVNGSFTGTDLFELIHQDRRDRVKDANENRSAKNRMKVPYVVNDVRRALQPGMAGCEQPYVKGRTLGGSLPMKNRGEVFEFLTVDANKAYMNAAAQTQVAYGELRKGPTMFDKALAGYWRVRVEPWTSKDLPDPAGYRETLADGSMWVTSPTLELLDEIGHQYTVYESWVGPRDYGLKKWAEALRDVCYGPYSHALESSAKSAANRTIGHWSRGVESDKSTGIERPDWGDAVRATFRANLWRKMYAVSGFGVYPAWIETDKVVYPACDETAIRAAKLLSGRTAFPEGTRFGEFKYERVVLDWPKIRDPYGEYDDVMAERMAEYSEDSDFDMMEEEDY